MALTQVQTSGLDELNKKIAGGYTPTATDTANLDYAKKQGYSYGSPTIASTTPITNANVPKGAVAISGAEFNTAEKQKGAFTNIQPVGNTLYGIPKAPIVPDVLPQKDFAGATTPQVLSEGTEKAKGMVSFTDQQKIDLDKANQRLVAGTGSDTDKKNVDYAKGKGWQPTTTEPTAIQEPAKSTADTLFEKMYDMGTIRAEAKAEAMKTAGLDEKSQAVATAQSLVNKFRTDLQNQGILDIKEQDIRRAQPILTSQIAANLNELSREQKLDTMILQNNYNNALVEQEIAQGNYDRAREIVKETADDAYNTAKDQIEALKFKNEIEEKTADKLDKELEYERDLAKEGYVLIRSTDGLKGLTEDKIYRDPVSGKIYMKPAPKIAQIIDVNGRKIGLDEMGNKIRDFGSSLTSTQLLEENLTVDENGNLVPVNPNVASADAKSIADAIKQVESSGNYNAKGASGENGAYQFMPSTWASWSNDYANQVLGKSVGNMAMTPENQDAVAQWKIGQWLEQGMTPQQIAAKWNSGSEIGWEQKIGTNKQGVAYNVPAYVAKVTGALNKIVGTPAPVNTIAVNWAENIRDGKAKLSDITSEVEKSNPGLKSEVNGILKSLPPSEAQINEAKDFVKKLKELKDNSGLKYAVGPNWLTRGMVGIGGAFGAKDDFLGKAQTLISKKALGSLIEAKSQGATFGALSDAELALLKSSGTTLSAWANEKNDKVTGFDISESKFKEELNSMITEYEKIISQANGGQGSVSMSEDEAYKLYQQIVNK